MHHTCEKTHNKGLGNSPKERENHGVGHTKDLGAPREEFYKWGHHTICVDITPQGAPKPLNISRRELNWPRSQKEKRLQREKSPRDNTGIKGSKTL